MDTTERGFDGARMQRQRRKVGLTQDQLAQAMEVSEPYVSLLESGQRTPSLPTLLKLADTLGVSAGFFLGEEGT